ncbi:hypothetical protein G5B40_07680 [Pikeienuella piscinae]|uniref:Uncharacterized protein n=1 Tax=Pikeienuella piscinae TaxID=2748098 RepID=A0A7L5BUA2_9RHOB|nr:hypothetical protein [Pikeienuella piscinae]QIE55345.1 hypothetical protein G5B40_07680 [Pikeienuella piscinae]
MIEPEENPLHLKDRQPKQGDPHDEPAIGGLYPLAGVFVSGALLGGILVLVAMTWT